MYTLNTQKRQQQSNVKIIWRKKETNEKYNRKEKPSKDNQKFLLKNIKCFLRRTSKWRLEKEDISDVFQKADDSSCSTKRIKLECKNKTKWKHTYQKAKNKGNIKCSKITRIKMQLI